MKSMKMLMLLVVFCACYGAEPVHADPITLNGGWLEFSFTQVGILARGCRPADTLGALCTPSVAGNSTFAPAPPWTFTAPATGALLTVTDAFLRGDAFMVFDFGILIGSTPLGPVFGTCGSNPDVCLADPTVSHGIFSLAPGPHSITIIPYAVPLNMPANAAYFRVDEVPEPTTMLLLATGLAGVAIKARKRLKSRKSGRGTL